MLNRIYVICHGETVRSAENTPTGNFADVQLSLIGAEQSYETARRLAEENVRIDMVYSSPHYQCLETLRPFVTTADGRIKHMVRVENGLRIWEDIDDMFPLCTGQCAHKRPTMLSVLEQHFSFVDPKYKPLVRMAPNGWRSEPPRRLLLRAHFLIHHLMLTLDLRSRGKPLTILLCTHAPVVLAIARVLTAKSLPLYSDFEPQYAAFFGEARRQIRYIAQVEFSQPDHRAAHCSITRFDRRDECTWDLTINGSQSHLSTPNGRWAFRPTPWQNRHTPNPVLWVCAFFRYLPESLLWVPEWLYYFTTNWMRELATAMERQLRNNPYRLPAWVYVVLWLILLSAIVNRMLTMDARARDWVIAESTREYETRGAWLDTFGNVCAVMVQFCLFMFPPLLV